MFRKLVENISFSPALIESLSRYAKVLKREEYIRRLGLIALVFALIVQITTSLYPSEQANVASKQDFIYGGITNLNNLIDQYDKNESHLKDIATSLGITKEDIGSTKEATYSSTQAKYVINTYPTIGSVQGEESFTYTTSNAYEDNANQKTAYLSPTDSSWSKNEVSHQAFIGNSINIGWFAIDKHNGSIVLQSIPSTVQPRLSCPIGQDNTEACQTKLAQVVQNTTQNTNATATTNRPNDRLAYTFTVINTTDKTIQSEFKVHIGDLVEYAQVIDVTDGGIADQKQANVAWSDISLQPGESISHTLTAKILHDIPATSRGYSSQNSYDCTITTVFATTANVPVECPTPKLIESVITELPPVTKGMILLEILIVLTAIFLYIRSRQLKEEVRLIRRDINAGSID